jgi:hypothetical protein
MGLSLSHLTFLRVQVRHVYGMNSPGRLMPLDGAAIIAGAIAMGLCVMLPRLRVDGRHRSVEWLNARAAEAAAKRHLCVVIS